MAAIATPAKLVLEDGMVDKLLKRPSVNLFRDKRPGIGRFLFPPGYYQELPKDRRQKVMYRAKDEGITNTGEELFLHVSYNPDIRNEEAVMSRGDIQMDTRPEPRTSHHSCWRWPWMHS